MSYGELRNQMNLFTQALMNFGFQKGERLGMILANMPQGVIGAFGQYYQLLQMFHNGH